MQLKHIEYFVKTCQFKSFNEAAKSLFISQPSLSAAIATLEQELGFALFYRSKNGITLTPQGAAILPEAQQMLDFQKHWLSMSTFATDIAREIRISAPDIICSTLLLDVIVQAQEQYPQLQISLKDTPLQFPHITSSNRYLSLSINFYEPNDITALQAALNESEWESLPLFEISSMLYINHQNPLAHQQDIYLEQLNAYHLVTYNEFGVLPYADIYQRFPKWQIKILPTREAMFNLIAKEPKYIGIFSSICLSNCSYIRDGIIYAKDLADYPMPLILVLFYPKNQKDDILVHTIKQLLINALFSSPLLQ